ncbi:MAG: hypothetical protein K2Z81_20385, partial [Cyanobacteria bacterium]|nr:hypothetical protein [Cyanobacteriota bacterium]
MPEISDTTDNPNREQVSQHSLVSLSQDRISTQERLSSAASVLTGGIADGTLEQAGVALRDPNTLLKLGGSALIGAALTIGNGRRGLVRLASHGATLSLGLMFANDVYHRGSITAAAVADTWNSPNRAGQNRALVADTMGPLVVDTAIYGIGGMTGAG